jgi:hypothetical protein
MGATAPWPAAGLSGHAAAYIIIITQDYTADKAIGPGYIDLSEWI